MLDAIDHGKPLKFQSKLFIHNLRNKIISSLLYVINIRNYHHKKSSMRNQKLLCSDFLWMKTKKINNVKKKKFLTLNFIC